MKGALRPYLWAAQRCFSPLHTFNITSLCRRATTFRSLHFALILTSLLRAVDCEEGVSPGKFSIVGYVIIQWPLATHWITMFSSICIILHFILTLILELLHIHWHWNSFCTGTVFSSLLFTIWLGSVQFIHSTREKFGVWNGSETVLTRVAW